MEQLCLQVFCCTGPLPFHECSGPGCFQSWMLHLPEGKSRSPVGLVGAAHEGQDPRIMCTSLLHGLPASQHSPLCWLALTRISGSGQPHNRLRTHPYLLTAALVGADTHAGWAGTCGPLGHRALPAGGGLWPCGLPGTGGGAVGSHRCARLVQPGLQAGQHSPAPGDAPLLQRRHAITSSAA